MIILRAAKVLNAPYEAQANVQMAKNAGLSPADLLRHRDDPVKMNHVALPDRAGSNLSNTA